MAVFRHATSRELAQHLVILHLLFGTVDVSLLELAQDYVSSDVSGNSSRAKAAQWNQSKQAILLSLQVTQYLLSISKVSSAVGLRITSLT